MARLAACLVTLRAQIDALAPQRDKASDGWIASSAHHAQNPTSDHEPDAAGIVHAIDITIDLAHGVTHELAEQIRLSRDPRVKYIISDRRIANPDIQNWAWRPYSGANPHTLHFHVSARPGTAFETDTRPWSVRLSPPASPEATVIRPRIKRGDHGPAVSEAQKLLGVPVDGVFGASTEGAVRAFQSALGMVVDGIVGPYTWDKLLEQPPRTVPASTGRQTSIIATVFSSVESGQKGAYGDYLDPAALYLALPATLPRGTLVRVFGPAGTAVAPVLDKGPWNTARSSAPGSRDDPYWQTGARPQAESGTDYTGRATNLAGIDLSPALAKAIGITGKGVVDWEFVGAVPEPAPVPAPPAVALPTKPAAPSLWQSAWNWFKRH